MLLPNLILLINVTFSTPTLYFTHLDLSGALECNRLWLLKNSRFVKIAENWDIENV
jgi:hypothetical protein